MADVGARSAPCADGTGVLLIGALGYVAAAVIAGAAALRRGLTPVTGMVSALPPFAPLPLVAVTDLVFGGWDIRRGTVLESARRLFGCAGVPPELLAQVADDLAQVEISPGCARNCGAVIEALAEEGSCRLGTPAELLAMLRDDIRTFRERHNLARVVVVNLASTEPPAAPAQSGMEALEAGDTVRAGSLYAEAAILEGCPFINFTPADAPLLPHLVQLAKERGVPVMGNDGKTGETLVKSALLPMFASRHLEVLSWESFNILGNGDGRVLEVAGNRQSKVQSKERMMEPILGYAPHAQVHIHYVPSLDDQKTAWDFIHFRGFLGGRMSLQFTWQGYDSLLAAPLVLDLVRFADLAARRGEGGLLSHLAFFFKDPLGVREHRLGEQFAMLVRHLEGV
jgi:myo-inositol-1-phosphate synthase